MEACHWHGRSSTYSAWSSKLRSTKQIKLIKPILKKYCRCLIVCLRSEFVIIMFLSHFTHSSASLLLYTLDVSVSQVCRWPIAAWHNRNWWNDFLKQVLHLLHSYAMQKAQRISSQPFAVFLMMQYAVFGRTTILFITTVHAKSNHNCDGDNQVNIY